MEVRGAGAGDGGQGARELLLVVAKDEISKFEVLHAGYTYVGYVPSFFGCCPNFCKENSMHDGVFPETFHLKLGNGNGVRLRVCREGCKQVRQRQTALKVLVVNVLCGNQSSSISLEHFYTS